MSPKPPLPSKTRRAARRLRGDMTESERALWQRLRNGQLDGHKFRRQHPIPPYVVDFFCEKASLVVEVDGSQHSPEADGARSRHLRSQGLRLLRFHSNEVLQYTDAVIEAIWNHLRAPTLTPTPLPEGEGL
ncbi:MAG TPA: endonuclease domain-containing protein [Lysobacter sp.]